MRLCRMWAVERITRRSPLNASLSCVARCGEVDSSAYAELGLNI